jgi:hypothetical protein
LPAAFYFPESFATGAVEFLPELFKWPFDGCACGEKIERSENIRPARILIAASVKRIVQYGESGCCVHCFLI